MNTRSFFRRGARKPARALSQRDTLMAIYERFIAEVDRRDLGAMTATEAARRLGELRLRAQALPRRQA